MRSVASRSSGRQRAGHLGERDVDRDRHHAQRRARPASSPAAARRRGGRGTRCGRGRRSRRRLISAFLLIGLVQSASAAPPRTSSTPRAMIATTAAAFAGSGRPGARRAAAAGAAAPAGRRHRGGRVVGRGDRRAPARRGARPSAAHVVGVADQEERQAAAERGPGLERDLAADPRTGRRGSARPAGSSLDDQGVAEQLLEVALAEAGDPLGEELLAQRLAHLRDRRPSVALGSGRTWEIETSLMIATPPEIGSGRVAWPGAEQQHLAAEGRRAAGPAGIAGSTPPCGRGLAAAVLARQIAAKLAPPRGSRGRCARPARRSRPRRARRRGARSRRASSSRSAASPRCASAASRSASVGVARARKRAPTTSRQISPDSTKSSIVWRSMPRAVEHPVDVLGL